MQTKLLRLPAVIAATGLSRMTIYRLEVAGEFPKRRRVSSNSVAWVSTEIEAWIESLPVARMGRDARQKTDREKQKGEAT
jgi:prophage regulatory protein